MLLIVTCCTFKKPDGPLHCECLNTKPSICCPSQLPQHTGSLRFLDSIPAVLSGSRPVASSSQGHIEKLISNHPHFQLIVDKEWRVKKNHRTVEGSREEHPKQKWESNPQPSHRVRCQCCWPLQHNVATQYKQSAKHKMYSHFRRMRKKL